MLLPRYYFCFVFFFQAEDGIRDGTVTGVQTCALPIWPPRRRSAAARPWSRRRRPGRQTLRASRSAEVALGRQAAPGRPAHPPPGRRRSTTVGRPLPRPKAILTTTAPEPRSSVGAR